MRLTPPDLASSPPEFQRADGSSVFRPKHSTVYTSAALLDAEDRLLDLARITTGPALPAVTMQVMGHHDDAGRVLGADQLAALSAVARSGRVVDVLVGPAGAGKTTALSALRRAWETHHGPGSVVGLAPSAAAAQILADELGVTTDNTAKWLYDHTNTGAGFRREQLVIIDEASLAGTHTLDRITRHAAQVSAKVLLVGDWAQLAAVEAGGAFGMLVRDRTKPPELTDVRRFHQPWEKQASLRLRHGDPGVIDTYQAHGRIRDGDTDTMIDHAYQAWQTDLAAGHTSVMIAQTHDTVTVLNTRARHDRILTRHVNPTGAVGLDDGTETSTGDVVITRRNNRRLPAGREWVKNGDRWIITATHHDGSVDVCRANHRGAALRLPADYVAAHVELAYAITAHRAQGVTVDTAHTIVAPGMTRETLYVAMTRGRHANTAYVATDQPDTEPHHRDPDETTGRSVLHDVLRYVGAEQSAHDIISAQQHSASTIAHLTAEYETIAAAAQHYRWTRLIRHSGLTPDQAEAVINSAAYGALCAALRQADAHHHNPDALLPQLIAGRPLEDADDIAAVLHRRIATATRDTGTSRRRPTPRLIVGLIPHATGPIPPAMREALDERKHLIEQRAHALAAHAIATQQPWTCALGTPPRDPRRRQVWTRHVYTIAAYRDRHNITATTPLGPGPASTSQYADAARAHSALTQARRLTDSYHGPTGIPPRAHATPPVGPTL